MRDTDARRGRGCRGRGGLEADTNLRPASISRGSNTRKTGRGSSGATTEVGRTKEALADANNVTSANTDGHTHKGQVEVGKGSADTLRVFSTPQWWLIGVNDGPTEVSQASTKHKHEKHESFQKHCVEKHAEMCRLYESTMQQDSEQRWLRKVSSDGTMGDKVASLTMLIQVCPVLSTGYIKALLTLASKMARGDAAMVVDALKDLFTGSLLPDRKLKSFAQMEPLSEKLLGKPAFTLRCVVAFFEDYLKTAFAAFIQILSEAAHSSVLFFKLKAIRTVHDLLTAKPEQERALLSLLVNKFGDLTSKVSSLVSQCLKKLEEAHPGMKSVIAKEAEVFLGRPNITASSQYRSVLHVTEMMLSRRPEDAKLAAQLVRLYVIQLERALRPAKPTKRPASSRAQWKRKSSKCRKGGLHEDDNRLIRTLISGIQRALPYMEAGLVASSPIETDTIDALFKVCHTVSAFSTRVAILSLLFKCMSSKNDFSERFYRLLYEQVLQFDFFSCAHRLQAVNLLKRCVPADISLLRGTAVGRRLLQVGTCSEAPVAVAGLVVIRELLQAHRAEMKALMGTANSDVRRQLLDGDDDAEEVFFDDVTADAATSESKSPKVSAVGQRPELAYEPSAREPRHARARNTPLWELHALAQHVHPFVAAGASRLVAADVFEDAGSNPFEDFSCGELLEQFAYVSRSRKVRLTGGRCKKQGGDDAAQQKATYNSERFAKRKRVLPHERFFQQYFLDAVVRAHVKKKANQRRQKEDAVDEEAGGKGNESDDEDGDEFFDAYLQEQTPKGEDGDSADVDDDSDMDDDFDASESDAVSSLGEEAGGGSSDSNGSDDGEGPEGSQANAVGCKRKVVDAALPATRGAKLKALKKKHSGSMFASADDFEQLLAEQYA
eukprot:TRINITY_DN25009_c0_g1_i1.p1 TRINITY_DN25009_c0_g1~~TRINITY_DN25009_c0_g1_i1.p1  ORF type:complete len:892 (-),score=158.44 TRINITY_DN25009_c0_g1_i1:611-3286(-)